MVKKFFKITSFLLVFVLLFSVSNYALSFKYLDSTYKLESFYRLEDDTVDVLVLGSSHAYQGINTAIMWKEFGYSTFNLCGPAQPIWNTYYYLEEALKTQSPKVIILDTYMLYVSDEYSESSYAIKNTYGLKWSQTKVDAINASFDTENTGYQYFFSLLQYHSRYSDLSQNDFYFYQGKKAMYENHMGFYCSFNTENVADNDYTELTECSELPEKTENYYRKIIELAQSEGITLLITAIPFKADSFNIKYINEAQRIAEEYGVPFYNFLREYKEALGIDYSTDFADNQHLNHLGNTKLTNFFGELITMEYTVPDKRGNQRYSAWDADAEVYYDQLENHNVKKIESLGGYLSVFDNDRYTIIVTHTCDDYDSLSNSTKDAAYMFFLSLGITDYKTGGLWVFKNGELSDYEDFSNTDYSKSIRLSKSHTAHVKTTSVQIKSDDETEDGKILYSKKTFVNKSDQTKVVEGINIYVYDTLTESTVDSIGFSYTTGKFVR